MGLSPSIINDVISLDQNISYNLRASVTLTKRNNSNQSSERDYQAT